jgi:sugar transferase EpsL
MIKRMFDLALVFLSSAIWIPVFLFLALLNRIFVGSPIFFSQLRTGKGGNRFYILKFRTMQEATDSEGQPLADHLRLTRFGAWLRSTSLDELPEIFNVLKGEMSLVGPRPLLPAYLTRYSPPQFRRHEVLPGITGWAQVNGRNAITWEEKFELDLFYVEHRSFLFDLKILLLTLWLVLRREGISAPGHKTMPEFLGSPVTEPVNKSNSR